MCNWKKWFLPGLLTMALLSAFALWMKTDTIESDLLAKSSKALEKNNFTWVSVEMDGRDAVITGLAPSDESQSRSASLVDNTYDVRVVDNHTDLMAAQSPYIFSAEKAGNAVIVSGYAPDEPTRASIIATAEQALSPAEISSRLELARGAPRILSEMAKFGFDQLAGVTDGRIDWSDQELTISGLARDLRAYDAINAALSGKLPGQSKLAENDVSAPVASPYMWAASHNGTEVALTGHVPSEAIRQNIVQSAKTALPTATIVDELSIASGEPETFEAATDFGLQQLARFSNGSAAISNLELSIRGVALDAEAYIAAKEAVSKTLPAGLSLAQEAISPARISPYRWAVNYSGNDITLTGFVPDVATREEIAGKVKSALPNASLRDQMQIADGAPPEFLQAVSFALNQLPRFVSGEVSLSDLRLSVEGVALDPGAYNKAIAEVGDTLPASMALSFSKISPPTVSPYLWSAEYDGKRLILDGFVPDGDARQAVLKSVSEILPQTTAEDRMQFAAGAPQKFTDATGFALKQLKRFTIGSVALSDLTFTINGVAADSDLFAKAKEAVSGSLPAAMSLADEGIKPPVVSPYRWAADYDGARLLLNGFVPDNETRASITRAAEAVLPNAKIENRMQIAAGEPQQFSDAAEFALGQLKRFEPGFVLLSDLGLTVKGTATDPDAYSAARKSLEGVLPLAMKLSEQDIKAAHVSPYTWSAAYDGDAVVLLGFAPDETARKEVMTALAKALPAATVTDRMQIANGAPENYSEATSGAITMLPNFSEGNVALTDLDLNIRGTAKSTTAYSEIESYLAGALPGEMKLQASAIQPPAARGEYLWQALMSEDAIVLEGSAPSKEARAQIEEKAKEKHPGKRIENRLVIETGAPEDFATTASNVLEIMSNFVKGTARIKGTSVDVTGEAKTVVSYETALKSIGGDAGAGFSWGKKNVRPATVSPYSWWVERRGDSSKIGGFIPDSDIGTRLVGDAENKFGQPVENRQRLAVGEPEGFEKATRALIASVSMLKEAKGTLTGTAVEIEGRASSEPKAGRIASNLEVDLPSSYRLRKRITYPLPKVEEAPQIEPAQPVAKPEMQTPRSEPAPEVVEQKQEPQPAPKLAKVEPAPQTKPAAPIPCQVDFKSLFRGEKILFETARAVILEESSALLSRIAEAAQQCQGALIEVGGHTDSRGTRRYNQALSDARASAVVAYLTRQGVPSQRLVAKGYGESKPIASNRRPKTRFKNRRIEFRVLETN